MSLPKTRIDIDELRRLAAMRFYTWEIAKIMGRNHNGIASAAKANGIPIVSQTEAKIERYMKLYNAGLTTPQIAKEQGKHKTSVLLFAKSNGLPLRAGKRTGRKPKPLQTNEPRPRMVFSASPDAIQRKLDQRACS